MNEVKIGTDVLTSVVEFMQGADGLIAKQASLEDALAVDGEGIIDALVGANLIDGACKQASIAQLNESPAYAVELLKRAAEAMQAPEVEGVGVMATKSASSQEKPDADQAFVDALM